MPLLSPKTKHVVFLKESTCKGGHLFQDSLFQGLLRLNFQVLNGSCFGQHQAFATSAGQGHMKGQEWKVHPLKCLGSQRMELQITKEDDFNVMQFLLLLNVVRLQILGLTAVFPVMPSWPVKYCVSSTRWGQNRACKHKDQLQWRVTTYRSAWHDRNVTMM